MEDFQIDLMIGQGPAARSIKLDLKRFTLVGATTRAGLLTSPLRDRFGATFRLDFYAPEELVADRAALGRHPRRADRGRRAEEIARRAAGRRASPTACCAGSATTPQVAAPTASSRRMVADEALALLEVDARGFDKMDRAILLTIIDKFGGGPVGLDTLAAADGRGAGHHRGRLRAVPDPGGLPEPDAEGEDGDGAGVRPLRQNVGRLNCRGSSFGG